MYQWCPHHREIKEVDHSSELYPVYQVSKGSSKDK